MLAHIMHTINVGILWFFIVASFCYILLLIGSLSTIFQRFQEVSILQVSDFMRTQAVPPVTIIVPAFNEAHRILECCQSLLLSNYRNLKIIIINDGSTDDTLDVLTKHYQLTLITPIMQQRIKTHKNAKSTRLLHLYLSP